MGHASHEALKWGRGWFWGLAALCAEGGWIRRNAEVEKGDFSLFLHMPGGREAEGLWRGPPLPAAVWTLTGTYAHSHPECMYLPSVSAIAQAWSLLVVCLSMSPPILCLCLSFSLLTLFSSHPVSVSLFPSFLSVSPSSFSPFPPSQTSSLLEPSPGLLGLCLRWGQARLGGRQNPPSPNSERWFSSLCLAWVPVISSAFGYEAQIAHQKG